MLYWFRDTVSDKIDLMTYCLQKDHLLALWLIFKKNEFWIVFELDENDREKVEDYGNTMISSIQLRCRRVGTEASIQLVFQFTFLGKF